jgi:hypothetical protein
MEHELTRQCSVGCLGLLTPEKFEEREWAFPAFGFPKKYGTVRFVIDFRRINVDGAHPLNDKNWWGELKTNHTADDGG